VASQQPQERRRTRRFALRLSAVVRERGRGRIPIRVIDISTHGCRIELSCGLLVGTSVWLSISGLETLDTRIVWCHEGFAGLAFTTPISEAVLDTLLKQQDQTSQEDIRQLRDIARRVHRTSEHATPSVSEGVTELYRDCITGAISDGLGLGKSEMDRK
jgi:hypothetical protein